MGDIIAQLAADLDTFEYDYDYYGYMDAVDDRQQALEDLKQDLLSGQYTRANPNSDFLLSNPYVNPFIRTI